MEQTKIVSIVAVRCVLGVMGLYPHMHELLIYSSPVFGAWTTSPFISPFTIFSTVRLLGRIIEGGRCVRGGRSDAAVTRAFCCKTMLSAFRLALIDSCASSTYSMITSAAMVSTIGTARGTTQGSCRPFAANTPEDPSYLAVDCS